MNDVAQVVFWYWWVLAGIFIVLEMLAPGTFMLWLGAAAGVVGLLLLVAPGAAMAVQFTVFAVCAVAAVFLAKRYFRRHPIESEAPMLNLRTANYVGKTYVLIEPIENGMGQARVNDSVWSVAGPDLPKGARVRVVGASGTVLKVEAAGD